MKAAKTMEITMPHKVGVIEPNTPMAERGAVGELSLFATEKTEEISRKFPEVKALLNTLYTPALPAQTHVVVVADDMPNEEMKSFIRMAISSLLSFYERLEGED